MSWASKNSGRESKGSFPRVAPGAPSSTAPATHRWTHESRSEPATQQEPHVAEATPEFQIGNSRESFLQSITRHFGPAKIPEGGRYRQFLQIVRAKAQDGETPGQHGNQGSTPTLTLTFRRSVNPLEEQPEPAWEDRDETQMAPVAEHMLRMGEETRREMDDAFQEWFTASLDEGGCEGWQTDSGASCDAMKLRAEAFSANDIVSKTLTSTGRTSNDDEFTMKFGLPT